jgi:hypothetical protein
MESFQIPTDFSDSDDDGDDRPTPRVCLSNAHLDVLCFLTCRSSLLSDHQRHATGVFGTADHGHQLIFLRR